MTVHTMYSKTTRTVWAAVGLSADGYGVRLFESKADAKRHAKFGFHSDPVSIFPMRVEANSYDGEDPRVNSTEGES